MLNCGELCVRLSVCLCIALVVGGCAGKRMPAPLPSPASTQTGTATTVPPPEQSLSSFMEKFRELSVQARPARQGIPTIESVDVQLREALAVELVAPTPEHMRAVAAEYRRLGVFDKAHSFLARALVIAPEDAATHEAIARLWRDSGFPALGLADAHRAVYFAPRSPEARNTLGTVLQALGKRRLARAEYERALALAPTAAYALNNLCYVSLLDRHIDEAITLCRRALEAEPGLTAARNNLALAYESAGDPVSARREFEAAGDNAAALYNAGIVHMARKDYDSAVNAFAAAHTLRPTMTQALARAKQAAAAAAAAGEE